MTRSILMRRAAAGLLLVAVTLAAGACSSDSSNHNSSQHGTPEATASSAPTMSMGDEHAAFDFGHPSEAQAGTRTIDVEASDELKFKPAAVEVKVGETVTFRVHNGGKLPHEFVLGTDADQAAHEHEMQAMSGSSGMMADEPNAVALKPDETKEITWTFTSAGTVLYGCHEPGHYAAGMMGTITVS